MLVSRASRPRPRRDFFSMTGSVRWSAVRGGSVRGGHLSHGTARRTMRLLGTGVLRGTARPPDARARPAGANSEDVTASAAERARGVFALHPTRRMYAPC